jgi:hypothetical protein
VFVSKKTASASCERDVAAAFANGTAADGIRLRFRSQDVCRDAVKMLDMLAANKTAVMSYHFACRAAD